MSIEAIPGGSGIMFAGKDAVSVFRLIVLRNAMNAEAKGLRMTRMSVYAQIKREFGLRGNKQSVAEQFAVLSERLIAEARMRDAAATPETFAPFEE